MNKFNDKVVLITGGTNGIGLATAKLFLSEGAQVIVTGRDSDRIIKVQDELGTNALVVRSLADNLADINSLMTQIQNQFGRLDVLVLNAGIANPATIDQVTEEQFDEIMNVNFKGVFFAIQKALPLITRNASIIAVTSMVTKVAAENFGIYAASKAALRSMIRTTALALINQGIRVNAVAPGPISTDGFERMDLPELIAKKRELENRSPMKRFGTAEEIAKVIIFLASDDASYIAGEEIRVDGGMTCTP